MNKLLLHSFFTGAGVLLLFLNGCVGYRLGSMLPPDIKTVTVPTFVNKTEEPLIEIETTQAAIEALQTDGSLRVVNEEDADAILEVTLTRFDLSPLAYDSKERTLANEYRLTLTASVRLVRKDTGEIIVDQPRVQGENTFLFSSDLTTAKRQALPAAARDLAHDIVESIVEYWK